MLSGLCLEEEQEDRLVLPTPLDIDEGDTDTLTPLVLVHVLFTPAPEEE